jgi:apolipoprotein N-acyltransferase
VTWPVRPEPRPALGSRWLLGVGAAVSGVVGAGAFPPVDLAFLGILGAALALWLMGETRTRTGGAAVAAAYALGYFGTLYLWSTRFGLPAYLALVVSQTLFLVPVGLVAARRDQRTPGRWVATVAGAWTLTAALRARVPLGGFEWGQLGTTAHGLPVLPAAAAVGTLGLTALLVALAAALVTAARPIASGDRRRHRWQAPVAVIGLTTLAVAAGSLPWTEPTGTLTVAAVQVDPVCPGRYAVDCPGERAELLTRHLAITAQLDDDIDLLLWGEGSLAGQPEDVGERVVDRAGRLPAPLLAGVTSSLGDGRFANRNLLYDEDGRLLGSYDKRQPVPFGEYVPARRWLGGVGDVGRLVPADMLRGDVPGQLPFRDTTLGTVSSWEVTFSRLVRDTGRLGEMVVTLTTQSTHERAAVSDQLLRTAQVRAVELRRPVLVAATTGRSAVIDASGQRVAESRLYGGDLLVEQVEPTAGETPFARWGDLPVVATATLLLVVASLRTLPPWSLGPARSASSP